VFGVVTVNFGVTFKTDRDGIVDIVCPLVDSWYDVVRLDFNATEAVTDAAPAMARYEQVSDLVSVECHIVLSS
jgi:hypothetical protein